MSNPFASFKPMSNATDVTDADFQTEVLDSETPILVDFWATWCSPCKTMSPAVDKLAEELSGRIKVTKLNIDENSSTASSLGVMSIPTFIVFKGGKEVHRFMGSKPYDAFRAEVEPHL